MGAYDYFKTLWQDSPSRLTPIKADELNRIENGVKQANDGLAALPGVYVALPAGTPPAGQAWLTDGAGNGGYQTVDTVGIFDGGMDF